MLQIIKIFFLFLLLPLSLCIGSDDQQQAIVEQLNSIHGAKWHDIVHQGSQEHVRKILRDIIDKKITSQHITAETRRNAIEQYGYFIRNNDGSLDQKEMEFYQDLKQQTSNTPLDQLSFISSLGNSSSLYGIEELSVILQSSSDDMVILPIVDHIYQSFDPSENQLSSGPNESWDGPQAFSNELIEVDFSTRKNNQQWQEALLVTLEKLDQKIVELDSKGVDDRIIKRLRQKHNKLQTVKIGQVKKDSPEEKVVYATHTKDGGHGTDYKHHRAKSRSQLKNNSRKQNDEEGVAGRSIAEERRPEKQSSHFPLWIGIISVICLILISRRIIKG